MRRIACAVGLTVLVMVVGTRPASADVIVAWDWNDGTTQGWDGVTTESNVLGRLFVTNRGNGSLQMFGPKLTGTAFSDWSNLSEIRFDVEIESYSGISRSGEFTTAAVELHYASPDLFGLFWDLDVTGWQFGQVRTFVVPVSQPVHIFGNTTKEQVLANVESANLIFSKGGVMNNSSAFVDNFIVTGAVAGVPEPSSLEMLLCAGMLIAGQCYRRRFMGVRS